MGALHSVENVEIHRVFQSRYLVGFDFAFVGVGFFMKNVGNFFDRGVNNYGERAKVIDEALQIFNNGAGTELI